MLLGLAALLLTAAETSSRDLPPTTPPTPPRHHAPRAAAAAAAAAATNATLRYISGGVDAVLNASHPGMPPGTGPFRGGGIEDGTIAVVDGIMHLFPTELGNCTRADANNPAGGVAGCSVYYYWHTRVGHWTAPENDRLNWTRHEPITPRSGLQGCSSTPAIEREHHAEYWSGSPQWDELTNRWYMSYVRTRSPFLWTAPPFPRPLSCGVRWATTRRANRATATEATAASSWREARSPAAKA